MSSGLDQTANFLLEHYTGLGRDYRSALIGIANGNRRVYDDLIARFDSGFQNALSTLRTATGRAESEYRVGREGSLKAVRQATEGNRRRAAAAMSFRGLANTSVADVTDAGLADQGAMLESQVIEQYSAGLSDLIFRGGLAESGLQMQGESTLASLRADAANRYAGLLADAESGYARFRSTGLSEHGQMQTQWEVLQRRSAENEAAIAAANAKSKPNWGAMIGGAALGAAAGAFSFGFGAALTPVFQAGLSGAFGGGGGGGGGGFGGGSGPVEVQGGYTPP